MRGHRAPGENSPQRHRRLRRFSFILLGVVIVLGAIRIMLPWVVQDYVNRALDRNSLYAGTIGKVQIHLWHGAYSINDIRLNKTTGDVPVPFFSAKRVDFAIQWNALLHRKIVGRVLMDQPEINFVDAPTEQDSQSGAGAPWLQVIR